MHGYYAIIIIIIITVIVKLGNVVTHFISMFFAHKMQKFNKIKRNIVYCYSGIVLWYCMSLCLLSVCGQQLVISACISSLQVSDSGAVCTLKCFPHSLSWQLGDFVSTLSSCVGLLGVCKVEEESCSSTVAFSWYIWRYIGWFVVVSVLLKFNSECDWWSSEAPPLSLPLSFSPEQTTVSFSSELLKELMKS